MILKKNMINLLCKNFKFYGKNIYKKVNIFRDNECLYCLNLCNITYNYVIISSIRYAISK